MSSMAWGSSNYFKLSKEPYNVDDINIKEPKASNLIDFEPIIIKPFGQRKGISEKYSNNHGILFDSPFGAKKIYQFCGTVVLNFGINLESIVKVEIARPLGMLFPIKC